MPSFLTWIQSKYNDFCQGNYEKSVKYTSIIIPAIVCQKRMSSCRPMRNQFHWRRRSETYELVFLQKNTSLPICEG